MTILRVVGRGRLALPSGGRLGALRRQQQVESLADTRRPLHAVRAAPKRWSHSRQAAHGDGRGRRDRRSGAAFAADAQLEAGPTPLHQKRTAIGSQCSRWRRRDAALADALDEERRMPGARRRIVRDIGDHHGRPRWRSPVERLVHAEERRPRDIRARRPPGRRTRQRRASPVAVVTPASSAESRLGQERMADDTAGPPCGLPAVHRSTSRRRTLGGRKFDLRQSTPTHRAAGPGAIGDRVNRSRRVRVSTCDIPVGDQHRGVRPSHREGSADRARPSASIADDGRGLAESRLRNLITLGAIASCSARCPVDRHRPAKAVKQVVPQRRSRPTMRPPGSAKCTVSTTDQRAPARRRRPQRGSAIVGSWRVASHGEKHRRV